MPSYDLKIVKNCIATGDVQINGNALQSAYDDFNWELEDIKKCLLKLTPNHFHKTEPYCGFPNTMMDYYKARNIMDGESIYTHFYFRDGETTLIVSSFKEL